MIITIIINRIMINNPMIQSIFIIINSNSKKITN